MGHMSFSLATLVDLLELVPGNHSGTYLTMKIIPQHSTGNFHQKLTGREKINNKGFGHESDIDNAHCILRYRIELVVFRLDV